MDGGVRGGISSTLDLSEIAVDECWSSWLDTVVQMETCMLVLC